MCILISLSMLSWNECCVKDIHRKKWSNDEASSFDLSELLTNWKRHSYRTAYSYSANGTEIKWEKIWF